MFSLPYQLEEIPNKYWSQTVLIKAQVISIQRIQRPRGDRLYTVLRAQDYRELGIWTTLDPADRHRLNIGDTVFLQRKASGQWHLSRNPMFCHLRLGLTQWLGSLRSLTGNNSSNGSHHRCL